MLHAPSNRPVDVLIVDHEPSVQRVLGRLLEREEYHRRRRDQRYR